MSNYAALSPSETGENYYKRKQNKTVKTSEKGPKGSGENKQTNKQIKQQLFINIWKFSKKGESTVFEPRLLPSYPLPAQWIRDYSTLLPPRTQGCLVSQVPEDGLSSQEE